MQLSNLFLALVLSAFSLEKFGVSAALDSPQISEPLLKGDAEVVPGQFFYRKGDANQSASPDNSVVTTFSARTPKRQSPALASWSVGVSLLIVYALVSLVMIVTQQGQGVANSILRTLVHVLAAVGGSHFLSGGIETLMENVGMASRKRMSAGIKVLISALLLLAFGSFAPKGGLASLLQLPIMSGATVLFSFATVELIMRTVMKHVGVEPSFR